MIGLAGRERILAKGKRRLLAAMLWRGLPSSAAEGRSFGTMRSEWLSAFPRRRGRAFLSGDGLTCPAAVAEEDEAGFEYADLGGES